MTDPRVRLRVTPVKLRKISVCLDLGGFQERVEMQPQGKPIPEWLADYCGRCGYSTAMHEKVAEMRRGSGLP